MTASFIRFCACSGILSWGVLAWAWAWSLPAMAQGPSAVILMYHRFGEAALPSTNIRLTQLDDHIAALKSGGHIVVPLADVVSALRGEASLPDRAVAITVDDAYRSFLNEGWPRFKAAGFPVTLFVSTAGVDAGFRDLLSWDDIKTLKNEGVSIGAHSHSHGHYPALSAAAVNQDLARMNRSFSEALAEVPHLFAFPYGEAGRADMAAVEAAGFDAAFGQHSGAAGLEADAFYLPRFALNEAYGAPDRFRLIIDALPLPVSAVDPADPVLKDNPPALTLSLSHAPDNIAALTCFGPGGLPLDTAIEASQVWITPVQPFPSGRARVNCTLPAPDAGLESGLGSRSAGRWYWFGWQMIAGFESEGVALHERYR